MQSHVMDKMFSLAGTLLVFKYMRYSFASFHHLHLYFTLIMATDSSFQLAFSLILSRRSLLSGMVTFETFLK